MFLGTVQNFILFKLLFIKLDENDITYGYPY